MERWVGALLLALVATPGLAEIKVDGRIDEPEWQAAPVLSGFMTTEPYTRGQPELATQVRVLATDDGLHIGFACDQPPSVERVRTIGQRDQFVPGDRVNAMIDFDGSGTTAYEFSVLLGGAQQDAVISRQVTYNYDWDGDWSYAVSESDGQWFVEYRIPWSIAPLGDATDGHRTMGVFFSRVVTKTGRRYSFPGNAFNRATFVSDMHKLEVAAHSQAQLDLFPYGAVAHDVLAPDTGTRAGLDLVWKPNG
ncbi:MAG: carbohydrate binding family 9 domain-containing protein, partial [Casimicrobiaceae bacterium]